MFCLPPTYRPENETCMADSSEQSQARRSRPPRYQHRSRSHESAHADESLAAAHRTIEHPLVPRGAAPLVTTPDDLAELLEHLRSAGSFAYDSEFIGELTYVPKLCLIQVATSQRVALIDPLAELNLTGFWELVCDPSAEKIVHAGQQDVEPVFRHVNRAPANLFDTQIAAGFAGMTYPLALSKLVHELTGARLGKGLTFTHWDQRPLSPMQLRYAADDVRYLPAVRKVLGERLDALGYMPWVCEESAALADPSLYVFDPESQYLRLRGANGLPPKGLAVLRELTIWRDAAARAEDVPPRTMLKDEILLDLSRNPVTTVERLDRVRGLPRPVEAAHGRTIVEATQRALAMPAENLPAPRHYEPTPQEKFRADALWAAAQAICAGQSIDPALVTSRQEIGELFRSTTAGEDAKELRVLTGWRRHALGEPLLELMSGKGAFRLEWADASLKASKL